VRVSVNSISTHAENITIGILLLLISLITAVLLIILPVPSMGPLNGTYKQIGTFSYHIPITLKEQSQFYQDNQTYNLNIQCWFPIINDKTSNNNCNVIMYSYEWIYELICLLFWNKFTILWTSGDPAQQAIESNQLLEFTAQDSGLPSFILTHLSLAHSNSMFIDIHTPEGQSMLPVSFTKMNDSINKFPIAIYSHGMYAWRQIASVTFEMLASNGYVVFSVDHLPSAMVTRPVNNIHNSVTFDYLLPSHIESGSANERVFYHGGIDRRAQEIIQVIDHLESILKADTVISNTQHNLNTSTSYSDVISTTISYLNLDISKLHIFGHSFGGGTCAAVSCRDTRVKSCVICKYAALYESSITNL
jgi:dienelactone hydrolase